MTSYTQPNIISNRQTDKLFQHCTRLQLQRNGFQESRAKKLLKPIQLQNFMIYYEYKQICTLSSFDYNYQNFSRFFLIV